MTNMIKVKNNSNHTYSHDKYFLQPQGILDIPEKVAEIWYKTGEVVEFVEPKEAKAKEEKALKEKEALEKENADLKAKLAKLEKEATAKKEKANK